MCSSAQKICALPIIFLFASCASQHTSTHYSPPSAAPVRDHVTAAQGHSQNAAARVAHASRVLGSASRGNNLPAPVSEALTLAISDLADANSEIDALLNELTNTQAALKDYETKVLSQTNAANRAIDEKNAAITESDRQAAKVRSVAHREHIFFLLLSGALIWIFRVPLWALLKIGIGLASKLVAV